MKQLYVLRHGRTEWNEAGRMQGVLDSPLTEAGRGHARQHGGLLRRVGVQRLIVSPLGRTRETAEIANEDLGAPVQFDERLVERHCGAWGGLTVDQAASRDPQVWADRSADPYHFRPPGGENLPDMLARVAPLLASLSMLEEDTVALVSHGVVGRVILTHFLCLTPSQSVAVSQPNDLVYRLDFDSATPRCCFYHDGAPPVPGTYPLPED